MPAKISMPIYARKELPITDQSYGCEGDPSYVIIKQARQHEQIKRQDLFKRLERSWNSSDDPNTIHLVQDISMEMVWREEAYMTLVECNLVDADGKILFPSTQTKNGHPQLTMDRAAFEAAWGDLFPDINREIIAKIHEVNPQWGGPLGEVS
jgi:hypothetical protein